MADILYKDFKTTILKMFKELKENVEEVMKMMCEQNGNVNKEIENLKRNQKRASGAENYSKIKNSLDGFRGRFEQAREKIIKLEDRTMEIIKSEE